MAKLYISEYESAAIFNGQALLAGQEPCLVNQVVEIETGKSTLSNPFSKNTHFVIVHADENCSVKFGAAPIVSLDDALLEAGGKDYFSVPPGHRMSVVGHPSESHMKSSEYIGALLALVADPAASRERLDALNKASADATEKLSLANATQATAQAIMENAAALKQSTESELDRRTSELAAREARVKAQAQTFGQESAARQKALDELAARLKADGHVLTSQRAEFDAQSKAWNENVLALRSKIALREEAVAAREKAIADNEADYENRLSQITALTPRKRA